MLSPNQAGRGRARHESSRPSSPRADAPQVQSRPAAPTPAAALRDGQQKRRTQTAPAAEPEAPFPQIRGTRLERLYAGD
ncbi:hypothetical protein NUW54_g8627 [Trametes sanguinea]|uniref:Uncharacterized protein n=1 Tax=Trametes sanguinea TaxID=158606 RepID=A0ACC1PCK1_9APHY|nr:hypothetical protein NUW54_g8627 [Trametes sanguinea]